MNWLVSLARVVGTSNPITAMAVQFSAEMDSRQVQERLRRLEDPISRLHPDVPEVSRALYAELSAANSSKIELTEEFSSGYSRVLAVLEAKGLIRGTHVLGRRAAVHYWLSDPAYVIYMAGLFEDPDLLDRIVGRLETTIPGTHLNGLELAKEYALPTPVVAALFQLCEQRGFGLLSREGGTLNLLVTA